MIFYQKTTSSVTLEMLFDALLCNHSNPQILHLYFKDQPEIKTLEEVLAVIEAKRKMLTTPNLHGFLCLEIPYSSNWNTDMIAATSDHVADTISSYFHDDIFVISLIYQDDSQHIHPMVILSDIEKSLNETSQYHLTAEALHQIINDNLPELFIDELTYHSLYLFTGENTNLAYDGVIHVNCHAE